MKFLFLLSFLLICLLFTSSTVASQMVGGWRKSDLNDGQIIDIINFGLKSVLKTTPSNYEVIEASQQVVAGMNYRVKAKVYDEDKCELVTFTVYDRFGDKSVTDHKITKC